YNFGVYAQTGGYNLNWVRITKTSARPGTALASASATTGETLTLYPNPVTDRLTLDAAPEFLGGEVSILSLDGRTVWRGSHHGAAVDVSALRPGLYTLVLTAQDQPKQVRRFSKE
ncbi:MAG: T9SS type A sorting domain-containing protein, partial [Bacteroidota bacterium]|nr:T9SS type A sorting domain-containing protein [Bacteroidota bacterium]